MDTRTILLVTGLIVAVVTATISMGVGPVYATGGSCGSCAKSFAPGQLAIATGLPASDFAPGHQVPPGPPWMFAPGIEKKVQTGPGP